MSQEEQDKLISRISKVEGQVRAIKNMLESKRNTQDILTQLSAIKSGINQIALELLFDRLGTTDEKDIAKKSISKFM